MTTPALGKALRATESRNSGGSVLPWLAEPKQIERMGTAPAGAVPVHRGSGGVRVGIRRGRADPGPGLFALRLLGGGYRCYEAYLAWDESMRSLVVAKLIRPRLVRR